MRNRILKNANLFTSSQDHSDNDAVFIKGGCIRAVGRSKELIAHFGNNAIIEDVRQSILLPSFTDSHIHLLAYGLGLNRVNCEFLTKVDCLQRISNALEDIKPEDWVVGHGWDHNLWGGKFGTKKDLDKLSNQHPIYLTHKSLHSGWANSAALSRAGINASTNDPEHGYIQHDASGEPTGIVLEAAMRMVEDVIPAASKKERESAIFKAQSELNKFGITAVHDFDPWTVYESITAMRDNRTLKLRVTKGIPEIYLDEAIENGLKSGDGDDWIKIGWLKLFADGALGPQTAAMIQPYENSSSFGMLFLPGEIIEKYGLKALPRGIALAVHAIGDRANREVLIAMSHLHDQGLLQIPSLNSRIEHVQLINQQDISLLAKLNVIASMQPIHAISDMDMAATHWGKRCSNSYAWKSVINSGAQLIFGSDSPVETPNPLLGLYAALIRKKIGTNSIDDQSWGPEQCLDLDDALNAYISNPSEAGGYGKFTGKIQSGYAADLILLSSDFTNINPHNLQSLLPLATMVAGNWVFIDDNISLDLH